MANLADLFRRLRHLLRPWESGDSPLELRRAVLDEIESRAVAVGGGRRLFPYDRLTIHLLAAPGEREALEAVARDGWDLEGDVRERLRERGIEVPADLAVAVEVAALEEGEEPAAGERRWRVVYQKAEKADRGGEKPAADRPLLELTVVKGRANRQVHAPEGDRVLLGRLEEVLDPDGRVKRRNDVAFVDEGEVNETVSREHARIAWDGTAGGSGGWWLRDEQSAFGTRIFRDGRSIEVSGSDRRGVRLRAGDEIYLGRACLKVGLRDLT